MLFSLFSNAGYVTCIKILRSKEGSAFVQMIDSEAAEFAKTHFDLLDVNGNTLSVGYSKNTYIKEDEEKSTYFQSYKHHSSAKHHPPSPPSLQLWCSGWDKEPDTEELKRIFGEYGEVTSIKTVPSESKFYVFVKV